MVGCETRAALRRPAATARAARRTVTGTSGSGPPSRRIDHHAPAVVRDRRQQAEVGAELDA